MEKLLSPDEVEAFEMVTGCVCCSHAITFKDEANTHCYTCRAKYHRAVPTGEELYKAQVMAEMSRVLPARDEFRAELEEIYALHAAKRSDYTAESVDRLANYRFTASMVGVPVERAMFGRMCEKIYRIKSIMDKGGDVKVLDESLADTLRDIAVIAVLIKLSLQGGEYGAK